MFWCLTAPDDPSEAQVTKKSQEINIDGSHTYRSHEETTEVKGQQLLKHSCENNTVTLRNSYHIFNSPDPSSNGLVTGDSDVTLETHRVIFRDR